jgi:hypothetical protein
MTSTLAMTLGAAAIVIIIVLLIIWGKLRRRAPKMVVAVLTREEYARILLDNPDPLKRHAALSAGLAPATSQTSEFPEDPEAPPTDGPVAKDPEATSDPSGLLSTPTEVLSRQQKRQQKRQDAQLARAAAQDRVAIAEPSQDKQVESVEEPAELTKAQKRAQKLAARAAKRDIARNKRAARLAAKKEARSQRRASDDASAASEILGQSPPPDGTVTGEGLTDPFTDGPAAKRSRPRRQKRGRKVNPTDPEVKEPAGPSLANDDFEVFTDTPPDAGPPAPAPELEEPAPSADFQRRGKQKDQETTYVPSDTPSTLEQDEYPPSGIDFDQALEELITPTPSPRATLDDERFITEEEFQNPDVLAPPELSPPPGRRRRKLKNTTTAEHTVQGIDPSELKKASNEAAALTRRQTKESKESRKLEAAAANDLRRAEQKRSREAARRRRLALREAAKVERSAKSEEKKNLRGAKGDARTVTTEDAGGVVVTMSEKDFAELEKERRRLSRIAISDARKAERAAKRGKGDQPSETGQATPEASVLQEHTLAEPDKAHEGSRAQKRESLHAMRAITKAERESVREGARIEKKRKAEERQRSRALLQLTQMQSGRRTPARMRAIDRRARKLGLSQNTEAPRYSFDHESGDIIYSGDGPAPTPTRALRHDWRAAGLPEPLPERGD